jgi:uncharacterized repeat protein (TIGR03803 family)
MNAKLLSLVKTELSARTATLVVMWVILWVSTMTIGQTVSAGEIEPNPDQQEVIVLYSFEAAAANTFVSPLGSNPDSRPVLGRGNSIYGMTSGGGTNGNGVIYRFNLKSEEYSVLHTFSATDANGFNEDGALPGVALTRGPDDTFYGMAAFGGANGNGTVFSVSSSGNFKVLHTFSALDANGRNEDGSNPLRTIVVGRDGKLYGTTRLGGPNTCGPQVTISCGVAWVMDRNGDHFRVIHNFSVTEGHAASLLQAHDGLFYGCAVWPGTSTPAGVPLPSGTLYRMSAAGDFQSLYTFTQTNANGANADGADCYEPLVETSPGVFYGSASNGGSNGNGVVFRYSNSAPGKVDVVHDFGATTPAGTNGDGAFPNARLTLAEDGKLYSTASAGGTNGNGVIYAIRRNGEFEVLHTFSAMDPNTGANSEGAVPDYGVILDNENHLIGTTVVGGIGSSAGPQNSGGTLYLLDEGSF